MHHIDLFAVDQPTEPQQPSKVPRSIRLETMRLPSGLVQRLNEVVLPTDQIRDAELEVVGVCGSGLVYEQLLGAARPKSLDEMQHPDGHSWQRTCETIEHRLAANAPRVIAEGLRTP